MASLSTTSGSFHLPQHTQFLMQSHNHRILQDPVESFSCASPPPEILSYFNPTTNETVDIEREVKVHEIRILFNYEIRHASGYNWESVAADGSEEESDGFISKAGKFFGGLFGKDEEEEAAEAVMDAASDPEDSGDLDDGVGALLELEMAMAMEAWDNILGDEQMTWVKGDSGEWECTGLNITDDIRQIRQRRLQEEEDFNETIDEGFEDEYLEEEVDETDVEEDAEIDMEEANEAGVMDTFTVQDSFSGTKLLGLTYQPLDTVDPAGCTVPDTTCTAIRGQISIAYAGTNEFGVTQAVIAQLTSGMESGEFIPSGSPALALEFRSSGGTAPVSGGGAVIVTGAERNPQPEEEESDLSKYGILFVCLVAILGAGFGAAMYVRYKKRKRKLKEANEGPIEITEDEFQNNLALQEEAMAPGATDVIKTETEGDGTPRSDRDSPVVEELPIVEQVELGVSPGESGADENEVEISLSGSKSFGAH